jgi:hypothetical protein
LVLYVQNTIVDRYAIVFLSLSYILHSFYLDKKQHAQHAAAARALDCLSYREGKGVRSMSYGLCDDDPYLSKEDAPSLPTSAPILLLDSKAELLLKKPPLDATMEDKNQDEGMEDRETYRQSRVSLEPDSSESKD